MFATTDDAETWLEENDPEGVAFEYEVLEWTRPVAGPHTRRLMILVLAIVWQARGSL